MSVTDPRYVSQAELLRYQEELAYARNREFFFTTTGAGPFAVGQSSSHTIVCAYCKSEVAPKETCKGCGAPYQRSMK